MQIVLIRHGATVGNLEGRYIGATDEPIFPQYAQNLLKTRAQYPSINSLICSPMRRCIETAELIYPDVSRTIEYDLRECDFGQFEGKTYEQLRLLPEYQAWIDSGGLCAFPEGESRADFSARCVVAFERRLLCLAGDAAAFIIHGGVIMALMEAFVGGDFYDWQVKNGEGYIAVWNVGQKWLQSVRPIF